MIVQFFITLGTSIAGWLGSLFAPFVLPGWLTDSTSGLYGFLSSAAGLGAWVPWTAVSVSVGFLVAVYMAMFLTKLFQRIWSLIPIVGGGGG